jgi:hypothetical protein
MSVLGWLFLIIAIQAAFGFLVAALIKGILHVFREMRLNQAHRKALHIQPEKGQVWIQDGEEENEIYIQDIAEDGTVVLTTAKPSYATNRSKCWRDTPERWKERVANRRLIRVSPEY